MYFCSKNLFTGQTLSRRDDIIQVIYTLVFMRDSDNYWQKFVNPTNQDGKDYEYIKSFKMNTSAKEFCKSEKCEILSPLLEEAYSYSYDE